jgi:hypothetical protein
MPLFHLKGKKMRTKSEPQREDEQAVETVFPVDVLADADREELEQLRAERDARLITEKVIAEAELKAATSVTINLPPAAGRGIHIAGREYLHGHTYQVDNNTKWTLEESERRCWAHESSLHESENKGRTKRRAFVG